jgi:tRNA wybutosine-synthesizing protein 3
MFDKYKLKTLEKMKTNDLSKKGFIDTQIKSLIDCINSKKNTFTTSSCSGRIVLVEVKSSKKFDHNWLLSSHKPINFLDIKLKIKEIKNYPVWFKTEPPIIHVCVRDIESAHKFLTLAKESCFKRAGIISINKKIIIEMIGNSKLDTIISFDGNLLVSDDYLRKLTQLANKSLEKNHLSLHKFEKKFNNAFE